MGTEQSNIIFNNDRETKNDEWVLERYKPYVIASDADIQTITFPIQKDRKLYMEDFYHAFYAYCTKEHIKQVMNYIFDNNCINDCKHFLLQLIKNKSKHGSLRRLSACDEIYNMCVKKSNYDTLFLAFWCYPEFREYCINMKNKIGDERQKMIAQLNMETRQPIDHTETYYHNWHSVEKLDEESLREFLTEQNIRIYLSIWLEHGGGTWVGLDKYVDNYYSCWNNSGNFHEKFALHLLNLAEKRKHIGNIHAMFCHFHHYQNFVNLHIALRRARIVSILVCTCEQYDNNNLSHRIFANEYLAFRICQLLAPPRYISLESLQQNFIHYHKKID
jgi:hypothetical protein